MLIYMFEKTLNSFLKSGHLTGLEDRYVMRDLYHMKKEGGELEVQEFFCRI